MLFTYKGELSMKNTIEILGKKVLVEWSTSADKKLQDLSEPLLVEMELYFSCLIRKAVRFKNNAYSANSSFAAPRLLIGFRPVMTKVCRVSDVEGAPPLEDFPIVRPEAYVPKWISIDYRGGKWMGEFSWNTPNK
jgi:hypothetical protein